MFNENVELNQITRQNSNLLKLFAHFIDTLKQNEKRETGSCEDIRRSILGNIKMVVEDIIAIHFKFEVDKTATERF